MREQMAPVLGRCRSRRTAWLASIPVCRVAPPAPAARIAWLIDCHRPVETWCADASADRVRFDHHRGIYVVRRGPSGEAEALNVSHIDAQFGVRFAPIWLARPA